MHRADVANVSRQGFLLLVFAINEVDEVLMSQLSRYQCRLCEKLLLLELIRGLQGFMCPAFAFSCSLR